MCIRMVNGDRVRVVDNHYQTIELIRQGYKIDEHDYEDNFRFVVEAFKDLEEEQIRALGAVNDK